MSSQKLRPPLPDAVPEQEFRVVRHYAKHLENLCLSDRTIGLLTSTAKHIAGWLALNGQGLDTFDIRVLDRFMRHECHCPGQHRTGRRPGRHCRQLAVRFLRHLLETGQAKVPPEIDAGGRLTTQFLDSLAKRRYARSTIQMAGRLCRHFIVWLHLSDIPLTRVDACVQRRFLAHDCNCVHPGFLDRPVGFAGADKSRKLLRLLAAFLADRNVISAPKVAKHHAERWEHLDTFLHWLRHHRGLRDSSIEQYERRIRALLPALGDDPETYDAAAIRNAVMDRCSFLI